MGVGVWRVAGGCILCYILGILEGSGGASVWLGLVTVPDTDHGPCSSILIDSEASVITLVICSRCYPLDKSSLLQPVGIHLGFIKIDFTTEHAQLQQLFPTKRVNRRGIIRKSPLTTEKKPFKGNDLLANRPKFSSATLPFFSFLAFSTLHPLTLLAQLPYILQQRFLLRGQLVLLAL